MSTPKFQTDLFPDPKFNPVFQEDITSRTRLAPGITMATFLGGHGDPVTLTHIESDDEKLRLAKQYVLHAQYMKIVRGLNQFLDYRIQVVESLYRSESSEILDASDGIIPEGKKVGDVKKASHTRYTVSWNPEQELEELEARIAALEG